MTNEHFRYLVNGWLAGTLSSAQADEFLHCLGENEYRELIDEAIVSELETGRYEGKTTETMRADALAALKAHDVFKTDNSKIKIAHRVHFLRRTWFKYAAAILIIAGTGTYLWNNNQKEPARTSSAEARSAKVDILPGGQKAILTLADGSTIILDSAANGKLAEQSGSNVIKQGGEIIYDVNQLRNTEVVFNTMSTPRGGQYQLILPDGSKVWLNAESSVTFPTAFSGSTREINMTGEAYFEIKRNAAKPFIVKTISDQIQVLGTSFNVNAYSDAPVKISLLEGKVKVNSNTLEPGQAFINGKIISTDLQQDIAWKNGVFNFNNLSLRAAMNQFARWYDVTVVYDNGIPGEEISGEMGRQLTLVEALEGLNGTVAQFRLEGKTVHVIASK